MIVPDAALTPYGETTLEENTDCGYCGRGMIARFGGVVGTDECPSCADEFRQLAQAGKITDQDGSVVHFSFPEAA